jgi:hypothetical protein
MRLILHRTGVALIAGFVLLINASLIRAQTPVSQPVSDPLPEAPQPQQLVASNEDTAQQAVPDNGNAQHIQAEKQLKEQEKQRIIGIVPSFNVSYQENTVSLTAGQKMKLALRSEIDPISFAKAFAVAGYHEAMHDNVGFPWGFKGYAERSGAAYLDSFDSTMIGSGILPSILHQEPRYLRLGRGTTSHRFLYAVATIVICQHDGTHKWETNYSNIGGNLISGALSNLYYPSIDSAVSHTFTSGLISIAGGSAGSLFNEFWPDISRKFLHRDPTHGLDAQARTQNQK